MRILLASIYPYAFLLLYLTIPFDAYVRALPNILIGVLVVAFPLVVKKDDFKKLKRFPVYLFLAFFGYLVLNALIFGRIPEDLNVLKKVLIALGLVILYLPVQGIKKISKAIIYSSVAAILFSVYKIVILVFTNESFGFLDSQKFIEALLIDRLYLGVLSLLSILVSYQSITKTYSPQNRYYVANILLNVVFVFFIMSKTAISILIVLVILRQFYAKNKVRQFLAPALIVAILAVGFSTQSICQKWFLGHLPSEIQTVVKPKDIAMRYTIWECALEVQPTGNEVLTGKGFEGTENALMDCYANMHQQERREHFVKEQFNIHNQYLDIYFSAGIIGVLLFMAFFVITLLKNRRQFFPTALLISMVLLGVIESYFHRQIGAYYFGFVLLILIIKNNLLENNPETEE